MRFADSNEEFVITNVVPVKPPSKVSSSYVTTSIQHGDMVEAPSTAETEEEVKEVIPSKFTRNEMGEREMMVAPEEKEEACWHCYKIVRASTLIFDCITEKKFCSEPCITAY